MRDKAVFTKLYKLLNLRLFDHLQNLLSNREVLRQVEPRVGVLINRVRQC